jgi:hypothetical protein
MAHPRQFEPVTWWNKIPVDDPRPLQAIATMVAGSSVAFRGYWFPPDGGGRDALVTGLDRVCLRIDKSLSRALLHERTIIREFQRRVHHYLPGTSLAENSLELLALMQHHGAPTRLLDWTYSLYVAAHFALTHASRRDDADLAIWAIRPDWCREASKVASEGKGSAVLWARIDDVAADESAGAALLSGKLPPSIWPVNPFRLNERLTIQQGLFLAPGDVTTGFLGNIGMLRPDNELGSALSCYIIPRTQSGVVQRSLYEMNITETTLFPGLDGFARSLWSFPAIEQGLNQRGDSA